MDLLAPSRYAAPVMCSNHCSRREGIREEDTESNSDPRSNDELLATLCLAVMTKLEQKSQCCHLCRVSGRERR